MFDVLFGWRKASKCKNLIKRVACRLKLLKNKRCCIVKQLRDDVAELLKHGHHQTAFERVEQLIVDENIVKAYGLLEQFCEFILLNLPYIRKHRDCPNDINEAASTLIFSSARFGELPELLSIRELFGERYGQRFVMAALELLPGNLVNRQIKKYVYVEKVADDVKYRLLDEIASSCIQTGTLLLEYKPELQEDQHKAKDSNRISCNELQIQNNNKAAEHQLYIGRDQTEGKILYFEFSSENERISKEACLGPEKQQILPVQDSYPRFEMDKLTVSQHESCPETTYLDEIEEFTSPVSKDQRLFVFKSFGIPSNVKRDHRIDLNLEDEKQFFDEKSVSRSPRKMRNANRAMTMPGEGPKETLKDNILRLNSYPFQDKPSCRHIHPKLPDYDELAAKFMEIKRANLQSKKQLSNL
ncbi:hypothetical protein CDL12_21175 [Handroanthus impetiginosus]|uniref:Spindle pole body protein n=1 Tax=Handroanthus impetiginosus TaxID=429701 RepID=A0A2G9GM38_9LAMI|nr:hypothetical protein CDL12_21175 [Handroanthus impetiginosus]